MPLLETILLTLGASLAKAIVKNWAGDGVPNTLIGNLIDIAKGQAEKSLGKPATNRIDAVAEQIAISLKPFFENEAAVLTRQQQGVIALEVADTLARARISSQLVLHNRHPETLARYLHSVRPEATQALSALETGLYYRTLDELASAILKIAPELEGFEREFSTLVLDNQAEFQEGLAEIRSLLEQFLADVKEKSHISSPFLFSIPDPPAEFTGRKAELKALQKAAVSSRVLITGMGGVGKTALALEFAKSLSPAYPDAQIYLDLKGTEQQFALSSGDAMAHIIRAFDPDTRLPDHPAELQALYRSLLRGKRALLLLDNALDLGQVKPLIPSPTCFLLVASRQRFTFSGLEIVDLDVLPLEDAETLLLKITPRIGVQAAKLAELCGRLPLALTVAGSALKVKVNISPQKYIQRLEDVAKRLALTGVKPHLQLSYDLLSPDLQCLFRLLSVYPQTFDHRAAAAVWQMAPDETLDALGDLLGYSLVQYDAPTSRYRLHDLVRLFAGSKSEESERKSAMEAFARHYLEVLRMAEQSYEKGGESVHAGLGLVDREWENVLAGQAWAAENAEDGVEIARLCLDYPLDGSKCLNLRLDPRQQITWLEPALRTARKLKYMGSESAVLGNLGNSYHNLGQVERAIKYHEQALAIAREISDRRGEGNQLGSLGNAYRDLGQVERAIEFYVQALAIAREIGNRRGEGGDLGNLGNAYYSLGQVERAIEHYEQALAIVRQIGDRRSEGTWLGNLGNAYLHMGQVERAIEFYQQALAIAREIDDWRGESNQVSNLGIAYSSLGQVERAIEFYQQALAIAREIGDRRGEGNRLGKLGNAYSDLGQEERAIEYHEQALVIAREIGDRSGQSNHLGNLGLAYRQIGQVERAIEYQEQALTIAREIGDRYAEGDTLTNLGNTSSDLGQVERGIEFYEQALAIARHIGDRRGEAAILGYLVTAYFSLEQVERAIEFLEQALAIARELGDRNNEGLWLGNLGTAYASLGQVEQGIELLGQALTIARQIGDRRAVGNWLGNLESAYSSLGQVERTIEYYEQALAIAREIGDRREEANYNMKLGIAYQKLDDLPSAVAAMQACVDIEMELGYPDAEADAVKVEELRSKLDQ